MLKACYAIQNLQNYITPSEDSGQPAQMRSLIRLFLPTQVILKAHLLYQYFYNKSVRCI